MADDSVVAVMQPTTPGFHDARTHEELEAAVASADAAVRLAEADMRRLEAALDFARTELQRAEALARPKRSRTEAFDKAKFEVETNEAALASAKAQIEVRRNERASAWRPDLIDPTALPHRQTRPAASRLRAPVTGRILKIIQESEAVVQAGTPLDRHRRPARSRSGGGPAFHRRRPDQAWLRRCGSTAGAARRCRGA